MITINNRVIGQISDVSVANDKEVVRLEFRCKNQVTELFKLTDSTVFINYQNGSTKDRYAVTDLTQNGEYVTFSWTLGANATKKQGKTFFVVCAVITEDEDVLQEWNTELAFFNVNKGLECETQPSEDMEDLFAQLTAMVEQNASDISALESSKQDKLVAGDNITIEGNVISATGGGGGGTTDYEDLENKPSINNVELNGDLSLSDLNIPTYTAGQNISISAENVISNIAPELLKFVDTLPQSNIDEKAYYLTLAANIFPDISQLATESLPVTIVTYNESFVTNKWRLLLIDKQNIFTSGGNPLSCNYSVYGLNAQGDAWDMDNPIAEGTNKTWAANSGITNSSAIDCIYCSNLDLGAQYNIRTYYYAADNKADVYGIPTDSSLINPYKWTVNQYVNGAWVERGVSGFEELFNTVNAKVLTDYATTATMNTALALKADAATTYTKTEVDSLISAAIAEVSDLIGEVS